MLDTDVTKSFGRRDPNDPEVRNMLSRLSLNCYKGFERFNIKFAQKNILVGPNNAGKSTAISALRLCSAAVLHARRNVPRENFVDEGRQVVGYVLTALARREAAGFISENVRHEFYNDAISRLDLHFDNSARLSIVWPKDDHTPFFYIDRTPGMLARSKDVVVSVTDSVGIVPMLVPIDHQEKILSEKHITANQLSRLTSRHFRNQIYYLQQRDPASYGAYISYALEHTPEITNLHLTVSGGLDLDFFYRESGSRVEKELVWAGDGLQIWLQVLYHIFRQANADALVLDEPDVFLHPDLQRRLVGILEASNQQVIFATHAPEILTEASRNSIIWVDRTRRNAKRVQDVKLLGEINSKLGSGFNLEMARALRSKVALFVEGEDMKLLRNLARTAGANRLAAERGVAVIRLRGFTNWSHVEPFAWMSRDLLGEAIEVYVILDRDYRTNDQVREVVRALEGCGVHPHVWSKKELESYLLVTSAMARIASVDEDQIGSYLDSAIAQERDLVFANYCFERKKSDPRKHEVTHMQEAIPEFNAIWENPVARLEIVPPKQVLSSVNIQLAKDGHKTLSTRSLSSRIRFTELSPEMTNLFADIENYL